MLRSLILIDLSMKQELKKAFDWILASFDNTSKGASARKLTAFWILMIIVTGSRATWLVWAWKHDNFSLIDILTAADYSLVAACLALTTYQGIKKKNDDTTESKSE
jgi:hypothetical protein